jgi:hypothetical protein
MKKIYEIEDVKLDRTCVACPEQYDAYVENKKVGYLRLRHGYFRVDFKDNINLNGKTIYEASPKGDGIFEEDEREHYLTEAKIAIIKELNLEQEIYDIKN